MKDKKPVHIVTDSSENKTSPNITAEQAKKSAEEIISSLVFKSTSLKWNNFSQIQPDIDRWIIIWCNLGIIGQNFFVTYKDASGNYNLPHPTKQYPAMAWAYLSVPEAQQPLVEETSSKKEENKKKS